jgi:hypothetical protein
MATTKTKQRDRKRHERSRSRAKARADRPRRHARRGGRTAARRHAGEARHEVALAGRDARRAGARLYEAGQSVVEAGQAGMAAAQRTVEQMTTTAGRRATEVAETAVARAGDAAEGAREGVADLAVDVGRTAVGLGAQLFALPEMVREGARRGREAIETTGARAVVSVIDTGTKVLSAAAEYVSELAPRRRVDHAALERLLVEQLEWAHVGTEAFDRTVAETDDDQLRMQLVRFKLQTIKEAEALTETLRAIGGRVPSEERDEPPPTVPDRRTGRGGEAVRQGLAHALTVALQSAEGWRALNRIATWAEGDRISEAIVRASQSVGSEPDEQVAFLRQTLLDQTVEAVLR